jgi:hypothetical protein
VVPLLVIYLLQVSYLDPVGLQERPLKISPMIVRFHRVFYQASPFSLGILVSFVCLHPCLQCAALELLKSLGKAPLLPFEVYAPGCYDLLSMPECALRSSHSSSPSADPPRRYSGPFPPDLRTRPSLLSSLWAVAWTGWAVFEALHRWPLEVGSDRSLSSSSSLGEIVSLSAGGIHDDPVRTGY